MPVSSSLLSYSDCLTFFEQAMSGSKGARVRIGAENQATFFRMRCNQARALHRVDNAKMYEEGHKLHGRSEFDPLQFSIRPDSEGYFWVYAIKTELDLSEVELLSEADVPWVNYDPKLIEHEPQKQIGYQPENGNGD